MKVTFATLFCCCCSLLAIAELADAAGKCGNQVCNKDVPCCVKGYCNSNAQYCAPFSCEPENSHSSESCWKVAHCVDASTDFSRPGAFQQIAYYKGDPQKTSYVSQFEPSNARVDNGQLELALVNQPAGKGFGATVIGTRAIQYGTVTAVMRAGSTTGGVVSSFIIRNDRVGDEIDMEFVGGNRATVQSNFYWHNNLDYTKMRPSDPLSDVTQNFHEYRIEWHPDYIEWSVDSKPFRRVRRDQTWDTEEKVFKYPDSESYISFSIWDGGSGEKGTRDWAGGFIDWAAGPFIAAVKSVEVDCFYKGNTTSARPLED